ncbi:importin-4-like [Littorina saxatilis]|uniref:Importin N-terminal domain-containing protein n=1 Tax=Littorina saxatilis TaxID=31220 RepID=A0AAN9GNJ7_9CAEN
MAAALEAILAGLLVPDNDVIQENTGKLKEAFKDPGALPALCHLLGASENPQVRQLAAVLIRRKVQKSKQWNALENDVRQGIRDNILQLLLREPERGVRTSIASLVGTAAKHDLPNNAWPQLFEFLLTYTKSADTAQCELGMFLLYTVAQMATEQLKPHLMSLLQLLIEKLNDTQNHLVPYYAIRTMSELVFFAGDAEGKLLQGIVPQVMAIIQQLTTVDEEKASEALELFDELLETEVAIIVPHLKPFMQFCLQVASNTEFGDELRVKAMSFIASLTRLKKKAVIKSHLVEPILHVLIPIMSSEEEEEDEEPEPEAESHTPPQYALQVLDILALHLAPGNFIPKVMPMVEKCLSSEKATERRAGYLAMAVVVEGCADYVMNKLMGAMLQSVCRGLNDSESMVRNAALFALGQFSEHLQPNITKYSSELLPLLFQYLGKATQEADKNPRGLTKSYYALEMFIENLGQEIMPYLPDLMNHLLTVLKTSPAVRPRELAISAIGAAATAACEGMKPYFQEIIGHFRGYLVSATEEDTKKLQVAAIDTLGVLARNIGKETFMPLATECVQLGLGLLENADDPDLRRCVYGLFAALSGLVKEDLNPYMEKIIHYLLLSLKSTEGVTAHYKEETEPVAIFNEEALQDEEDIQDSDGEDSDALKLEGISVENAYLEEKEDACCALGELAQHTSTAFLPYLEKVYTEVLELVEYPAVGIKKAAIATLGQLCFCVHETCSKNPSGDAENALKAMLCTVVPKYLEIAKEDQDRTVVMAAVDSLHELLERLGLAVLQVTNTTDAILQGMKDIFTHKVACQDQEEDEDEQQAEYDGMLIESAGDVLPIMARLMGGEAFSPFFASFLTDLLKRLKQTSSTAEKSFAVGTLAEVIESIGHTTILFVDTLYPVFVRMVKEEDDEVRSNAVFALGMLAANGGDKMKAHHADILKQLLEMLNGEENLRVIDNMCAAICRMIWTNAANLPLEYIVPAVIQCLPLKEDFEENTTVFTCLLQLYQDNNPQVMSNLEKLLQVVATILGTPQAKPDTQKLLVQFVQNVKDKYPEKYGSIKGGMPGEMASKLDHCLTIDINTIPTTNGCHKGGCC